MESDGSDRRKESRYPVAVEAAVEAGTVGQDVPATTLDLSVSGARLLFKGPFQLVVGDEVTCEFKFGRGSDKALPCWGVGSVVRVEGSTVAIELSAGTFVPAEAEADQRRDPSPADPARPRDS